jgi:hypothetical protein
MLDLRVLRLWIWRECSFFLAVSPCISWIRRFGGTYRLYLQGRRISQARNQQRHAPNWAYSPTLKMETIYSPKRRTILNYLAIQPRRPHFAVYLQVHGDKLAYEAPGSQNDCVTEVTEKMPLDLGARDQHQETKHFTG